MDGKYDEALSLFNQSLTLMPDAIIYGERATLRAEHKDISGAIADYDKAIALKPDKEDLATLLGNRASLKQQTGDLDGALVDYNQVIALLPREAVIYNSRRSIKSGKGDFAGALADYSKAIELDPGVAQFLVNRAEVRLTKDDFMGALADYDQAVALEPKVAMHYYERGNARQRKGDLDGALVDFSKICELRPDADTGYYVRGIVKQAKADYTGALTDYDKAIALAKNDAAAVRVHREITLRQLHRGTPFAELAKSVAIWKDGWPKNIGLYLVDALSERSLEERAGKGKTAQVKFQQCSANYFIGMTRRLAGDMAAAQKYFEQCVATKLWESDELILARAELAQLTKKP